MDGINGTLILESVVTNDFKGWTGDTVFVLQNGQVWQQSSYKYQYMYAYRPHIQIVNRNGQYLLIYNGNEVPVKKIK